MRSNKLTKRSRHATSKVILIWIMLSRRIADATTGLIHLSISILTLVMMKATMVL